MGGDFGIGFGFSSDTGPFGIALAVTLAVILIAAWVILAGSRFVQGGIVERPERVPQLYGYTVCLVALIWAVTSTLAIVDSVLALRAPDVRERSEFSGWEPSVTSFEAFRATYDRARQVTSPSPDARPDPLSEDELRRRFEALRLDRIRQVTMQSERTLVVRTLSLVISLAVFAFHWRWLRRREAISAATSTT